MPGTYNNMEEHRGNNPSKKQKNKHCGRRKEKKNARNIEQYGRTPREESVHEKTKFKRALLRLDCCRIQPAAESHA